jgi:large subunit ribosomal protein L17
MRHRRKTVKLGRKSEHRNALLANLAISLIKHKRVKTTLAKAKATRPLAEKLVTLGKKGGLHHRRLALSKLMGNTQAVSILFKEVAPKFQDRAGGYTRILKLGQRPSDASQMALIEWVDYEVKTPAGESKEASKTAKTKALQAEKAENSEESKKD